MQKAGEVKVIHADATYKLIWQGFPVFVVGSTDKNKRFHPFALGVATNEEKEDFKLLFDAIKINIFNLYSQNFKPEVLVCDAAKAIQNAFTEVFGKDVTVRMCWAHAKKKIQLHVEKYTKKTVHRELLADVDSLQAATDSETFELASKAFLKKWDNAFIQYFEEQWLTQNRSWYLGAHMGSPATNNALESHNRVIKDEYTLRERLPLSRFLTVFKWQVDLPHNDWMQGKCNCPAFYKNYMCKHIMGLAIRLKFANPPPEAKNVPIGQKRKRGRPSKSRPALVIQ
ncbi:uncharacterized protein LOC125489545 [Plutella xylostella]|uniref:uncharacterized protein LOC125489545 n=1 Tax=Plutella xylostella TaxID=51655 RepID=UPI0020323F08|nr:uncharacterized protein LOC125489545 [Plutella xylostella]